MQVVWLAALFVASSWANKKFYLIETKEPDTVADNGTQAGISSDYRSVPLEHAYSYNGHVSISKDSTRCIVGSTYLPVNKRVRCPREISRIMKVEPRKAEYCKCSVDYESDEISIQLTGKSSPVYSPPIGSVSRRNYDGPSFSKDGRLCYFGRTVLRVGQVGRCTREIISMMNLPRDAEKCKCEPGRRGEMIVEYSTSNYQEPIYIPGTKYYSQPRLSKNKRNCWFSDSVNLWVDKPTICTKQLISILMQTIAHDLRWSSVGRKCVCIYDHRTGEIGVRVGI